MRIRDLTVEIAETKDTVTCTDSALILHRECLHGAVVISTAISELTGHSASRRAYEAGHAAVPCLNGSLGFPAPLAPHHGSKVPV